MIFVNDNERAFLTRNLFNYNLPELQKHLGYSSGAETDDHERFIIAMHADIAEGQLKLNQREQLLAKGIYQTEGNSDAT